MFEIGDKIFYPVHGAGIVEGIEEKDFLGEKRQYYILDMILKGLQIMVPLGKMSSLGIRQVVNADMLETVFEVFHHDEPDLATNSTQRQRIHQNKLKSGDIFEGAEVIRDLISIGKKRDLGTSDKMMLDHARQVFISELMLVKDMTTEEATDFLHRVLDH